jgi:hypothetical protein
MNDCLPYPASLGRHISGATAARRERLFLGRE